ncbi:DUF6636 domain-containing protein [Mycobacterium sp. 1423905.2]|uniref:DUF6636 domain-containing protein n=1 Tax=Mycobacterium sp. 1423905.2 TaxID=1856859 RepID=UPI0012E9C0D9|nr:DUF6636 domain-containing protein [Mycobacterium sp. 1423905.2]
MGSVAARAALTALKQQAKERIIIKVTVLASSVVASLASCIGVPAAAAADPVDEFQSPSGNIVCHMYTPVGGTAPFAYCQIAEHTWVAPARSSYGCPLAPSANQFRLNTDDAAAFACMTQHIPPQQEPTLSYGRSLSIGTLTCASEPSGMTCSDAGTGHFFRIARDTYELG